MESKKQARKLLREAVVNSMTQASSNNRSGEEMPMKPIEKELDPQNSLARPARFISKLSPDLIEDAFTDYLRLHKIEHKARSDKYQIDFTYLLAPE